MNILRLSVSLLTLSLLAIPGSVCAQPTTRSIVPNEIAEFLATHCLDCHDQSTSQGGLSLDEVSFDLSDQTNFDRWVLIHDRVQRGEMPPRDYETIGHDELEPLLAEISAPLLKTEAQHREKNGRAPVRRLNRFEYERTLAELLHAPWLQIADRLPEDGVAHHFNKVGSRLDISHVQMMRYLEAANYSLRAAINAAAHPTKTERSYARVEPTMLRYMKYRTGQRSATRSIMPLNGITPQPDVIRGTEPLTVGEKDPVLREQEAMGVFSGTYEATTKYDFTQLDVPTPGKYRLRFKTYSFLAGTNGASGGNDHGLTGGSMAWWRPNRNFAFRGTRSEPVTLYALSSSGDSRWIAAFDSHPEPTVFECDVFLAANDAIRPDATRLVRTRPGWDGNPNATKGGIPGLAMNWLELEGPLQETWPPASYQAVFGSTPFTVDEDGQVQIDLADSSTTVRSLILDFMKRAIRRPLQSEAEAEPFIEIHDTARRLGENRTDALLAAFSSILCSTDFIYLESAPGKLNAYELASRIAYFLWNGPPDDKLIEQMSRPTRSRIRNSADRLLSDSRAEFFIDSFLDYWLDLRYLNANAPDAELYPDYYLDDLLTESSLRETRMYFKELVDRNLPVTYLVDAPFIFANERLAELYGLPPFEGVTPRRVELPAESERGGLLTQASVLRVTANGTTTSPVIRGAWVMERILGLDIPPPPSGVPAVEPDIRGATTIREQLDKHRAIDSCRACHARFDPPGFALESFDVAGGWRDRYRATGEVGDQLEGLGKNGHAFDFRLAQPVECFGELEDGQTFQDIQQLKQLLVKQERQLARNLLQQFIVYGTGAAVQFSDRQEIEEMLDRARDQGYGVRSLIYEVIDSDIFRNK